VKVVTWNCGGAFRKKNVLVERAFEPDVLVVQECEDPAKSTEDYRKWAGSYVWTGTTKNRGIGVFDRTGAGLRALEWDAHGLESFLPVVVGGDLTVIGVWTRYANSPNFRYIGQVWKYIQIHRETISSAKPLLVCGDLNSNTRWDEWDRWWNHSDVVRELQELGLTSLYHRHFQEAQGAESRPTLFHRRNLEKPYHVDYAFASEGLFKEASGALEVGDVTIWLEQSDHMPLAFEISR
jgi:exonuclease III